MEQCPKHIISSIAGASLSSLERTPSLPSNPKAHGFHHSFNFLSNPFKVKVNGVRNTIKQDVGKQQIVSIIKRDHVWEVWRMKKLSHGVYLPRPVTDLICDIFWMVIQFSKEDTALLASG